MNLFTRIKQRIAFKKEMKTRNRISVHLGSCCYDVDSVYRLICKKYHDYATADGKCDGMRRAWKDCMKWLDDENITSSSLHTIIDEHIDMANDKTLDILPTWRTPNSEEIVQRYADAYYPAAEEAYQCVINDLIEANL